MRRKYKEKIISKELYDRAFPDKQKALDYALDIRKFEIELYWKRATYFWAFIAVAFAGYFAILSAEGEKFEGITKDHALLIVSCLGFVFTFGWYVVNRGSKFWQNNWERHVDMLEDDVIGPLYKTSINMKHAKMRHIYSEYPFSVSRVNQILSLFLCLIWIIFLLNSSNSIIGFIDIPDYIFVIVFCGMTILFVLSILIFGRSTPNIEKDKSRSNIFITRNRFLE
ncbi:hypothetical protein [Fredinandcohnia quinoae]|uniref:DUF4231 domain-containing protein n=1 Tax=Fredinandcohnia quinoae TaxID=2918902 RepID=A0AAW5E5J8_9BACI|nr:hypothetical protein [Fredinandcohnia sp. SECRCQ15]MCH1627773.1 hypothetical protein [Fredinandcohnia sp. SECRCQ15]